MLYAFVDQLAASLSSAKRKYLEFISEISTRDYQAVNSLTKTISGSINISSRIPKGRRQVSKNTNNRKFYEESRTVDYNQQKKSIVWPQMRPIATNVARSVVCVCVGHTSMNCATKRLNR